MGIKQSDDSLTEGDAGAYPSWVPAAARSYLAHVAEGQPIRAVAREAQVHASTILRQVRKLEAQRDDPLVDEALRNLGSPSPNAAGHMPLETKSCPHSEALPALGAMRFEGEALRILRRLAESGTMLVVGREMEMAVVVREGLDGEPQRIAICTRDIASALALKDFIASRDPNARVARYAITAQGRAELRRAMSAAFETGDDRAGGEQAEDPRRLRHMRSVLPDSPVTALARRHDKSGKPFLARHLVVAAERLREDYELSRAAASDAGGEGSRAAALRLQAALDALGPGLADVALRCCCYLEGLERIETRMEWSARSGEVVLRIALARLDMHYASTGGRFAPLIGERKRQPI